MARRDLFLEQLAEVPLFSALSKRDLTDVAKRADLVSVSPGKVIVIEGAAGSEFFAILEGRARVERRGRQVALLGPGNFFGDLALLDRAPRNASVVAETDMELARSNQRAFDALLDVPGFAKKLLAGLARRLREQDLRAWVSRSRIRALAGRGRRAVGRVARRGHSPICDDVAEWAAAEGLETRTLLTPRQITRHVPRTVEPQVTPNYLDRLVANQKGRSLVALEHARLVGRSGVVVLPDGSFAAESVYNRALLEEEPAYQAPRRRARAQAGNYFSLMVIWANGGNYYHWFHDTLTRLFGVVDLLPADTKYIVPAALAPFQLESLRLLGVGEDRIVRFTGDEAWELETLHFAPPTTNSGSDRRDADQWVRDRILDGYGIVSGAADRRIFVSRRHASERRLANEVDVERFLRGYAFETCIPEDLSLREQVALFSEAAIVVSPHGAGFTNMLFAPPGLVVVDMIEPGMFDWTYVFWTMAEELGHEYWYLVAESVPRPGRRHDALVPLDKLAATLDRIHLAVKPPL